MMNLDEIKRILELAREHSLSEFELEQQGIRLRIKRDGASPLPDLSVVKTEAGSALAPASQGEAGESESLEVASVKSPIVGTFYRASNPNARPFVEIGDRVKRGQVLCIIEAMKLMNEIESEYEGEIVSVHVENGQPVQYGERLFAVKTCQFGGNAG